MNSEMAGKSSFVSTGVRAGQLYGYLWDVAPGGSQLWAGGCFQSPPGDMGGAVLVCMDKLCLFVGFSQADHHWLLLLWLGLALGSIFWWSKMYPFKSETKGPPLVTLGGFVDESAHPSLFWESIIARGVLEWFLGHCSTLNIGDTLLNHRRNRFCPAGADGQNEA